MTTRCTIAISQERRRYIIVAEQGHCLKCLKERYIQYDTVASHASFKLAMRAFWIIPTHWSYPKAPLRSLSILSFLFLIWSLSVAIKRGNPPSRVIHLLFPWCLRSFHGCRGLSAFHLCLKHVQWILNLKELQKFNKRFLLTPSSLHIPKCHTCQNVSWNLPLSLRTLFHTFLVGFRSCFAFWRHFVRGVAGHFCFASPFQILPVCLGSQRSENRLINRRNVVF